MLATTFGNPDKLVSTTASATGVWISFGDGSFGVSDSSICPYTAFYQNSSNDEARLTIFNRTSQKVLVSWALVASVSPEVDRIALASGNSTSIPVKGKDILIIRINPDYT